MKMIFYFHLTCLGWLFFAVQKVSDVPLLVHRCITQLRVNPHLLDAKAAVLTIIVFGGPVLLLEWLDERNEGKSVVLSWPRPVRLLCYATVIAALVMCGSLQQQEFIYFQF